MTGNKTAECDAGGDIDMDILRGRCMDASSRYGGGLHCYHLNNSVDMALHQQRKSVSITKKSNDAGIIWYVYIWYLGLHLILLLSAAARYDAAGKAPWMFWLIHLKTTV